MLAPSLMPVTPPAAEAVKGVLAIVWFGAPILPRAAAAGALSYRASDRRHLRALKWPSRRLSSVAATHRSCATTIRC